MLHHLKLDDDVNQNLEECGDLAQEIKERTVKGFDAFLNGHLDFSYHQYSIINDLKRKHYRGKHEKVADCIIRTSLVLEAQGNIVSAILQKNLALEMYKSLNVSEMKIIDILLSVGNLCHLRENYENALLFFKEAHRRAENLMQSSTDRYTYAIIKVGRTYSKLGRNNDAISFLEKGLQLQWNSGVTDDVDIAQTLIELGDNYFILKGCSELSIDAYSKAMMLYERGRWMHRGPRMIKLQTCLDDTENESELLIRRLFGEEKAKTEEMIKKLQCCIDIMEDDDIMEDEVHHWHYECQQLQQQKNAR
mmetsp:Transcript_20446/g.30124  ORF Transcript_20446/g.30124 Transcript_20446/m.30124 type:complete len:306 (+) Transcript_20446:2-919(+)